MIEVEKKFLYNEATIKTLTEGAEFVGEKIFTDSYFDNETFSLTTKDIWFRKRGERFELKLPLNVKMEERVSDQYKELETEKEIADYFKWNLSEASLEELVKKSGFNPFATFTTTRKKYKKDDFTIDIDTTDFGFNIIEIEIMVSEESDIEEGIKKILEFASSIGSELGYVCGKGVEFLKKNNPEHLQKLIEAKVVK